MITQRGKPLATDNRRRCRLIAAKLARLKDTLERMG